ncbi:glutathione S-transferase U7-like [Cornus florida]|uniref:glutathione S-transferase U7-like n=1 Tax=Cornus florida TaxID=4283 RepID=UPI0028992C5F|nr:glutathione S-transferase U7-like [Cornus florida]
MGKSDLKLLGTKASLFPYRIVWALKLKGIEYEFVEEDLFNKSPLLLQSNPIYRNVPVLIHGGKPISESLVILEYIDDTWKHNPILPKHPQQRAYARFWAKFVDEKFCEAARQAFFSSGEDQANGVESMEAALRFLEGEIAGKKFFGGEDSIGFLDIVVGWIAYWFQLTEEVGGFKVMDSVKYPAFAAWIKNFLDVPVIKENLPLREDLRRPLQGFKQMGLARADDARGQKDQELSRHSCYQGEPSRGFKQMGLARADEARG